MKNQFFYFLLIRFLNAWKKPVISPGLRPDDFPGNFCLSKGNPYRSYNGPDDDCSLSGIFRKPVYNIFHQHLIGQTN
ncbi:MAG: hypothetical protein P8100_05220 [bacterium]|jgi:hypothetical protein